MNLVVEEKRRGRAMAIYAAMFAGGMALLAGLVTVLLGYQSPGPWLAAMPWVAAATAAGGLWLVRRLRARMQLRRPRLRRPTTLRLRSSSGSCPGTPTWRPSPG